MWATDVGNDYLRGLRNRYEGRPNVDVVRLDLTQPLGADNAGVVEEQADTAVAFNVVEHLEDDLRALRTLYQTLQPGGRLLLVVPAHPFAYGALDKDLEHFRRYTRAGLEAVLAEAGFEIESTTRANSLGLFGWWFNGRILRRSHVPSFQAKINSMLVPWLRLERALHVPFGLSLVVVAKRPQ